MKISNCSFSESLWKFEMNLVVLGVFWSREVGLFRGIEKILEEIIEY